MAQTTYSQNIVGYANIPTPIANANYLITVPFVVGVSNGLNEIFPSTLPIYSSVLIWSVGGQGYTQYLSDNTSPTGWDDNNYNPLDGVPTVPVGQGFFFSPSSPTTNTFAGTIAVNVGTSNNMVLSTPNANYLLGCVVPYAGPVSAGNNSTGGPNLNNLPIYSSMLVWDVPSQGYVQFLSDNTSPSGWDDNNYNPTGVPSISVGQGFFLAPSDVYTWTTGL